MADRIACQRRVYRLALLLTGDEQAAMTVVQHVVDAQPKLDRIDSAHLDRLTVLRSREHAPGSFKMEGVPVSVAAVLRDLPVQHREAWIFSRVYRLPMREMSRAMDCSTTAVERHLDLADAAFRDRLDEDEANHAAERLLKQSMTLDAPRHLEVKRKHDRMIRFSVRAVLILLLIAIVLAAVFGLVQLFGEEMAEGVDHLFDLLDEPADSE